MIPPLESPEPEGQDQVRLLPQNLQAERALLGAVLLSPAGRHDVLTAGVVDARSFHSVAHGLIWDAVVRLDAAGAPVDAVSVVTELIRSADLVAVGGPVVVTDLLGEPSAPAAALTYAEAVAEAAAFRRLVLAGAQIQQIGYGMGDVAAAGAAARELVEGATEAAAGAQPVRLIADEVESLLEYLDVGSGDDGVPWPWRDLDEVMNPIMPGQFILIGGRPSTGKSIVGATGFGVQVARTGVPVLEITIEMGAREYVTRKIAHTARVMLTKMKKRDLTERDWEAIAKAQGIVAELPVVVDDTETVTLDYVRSAIRRGIPGRDGDTRRPRIVVIDYVQLMKSTGRFSSRQEEVAALSRGLKLLAKSEQVAIIGLVQLNRGPDGRSDKTPVLADIRESGQLENDADIAILLHRPDMYEKESPRAGEIDFIVAKNRDGWTGTIPLCFAGHYSSILDMARDPWGDDS